MKFLKNIIGLILKKIDRQFYNNIIDQKNIKIYRQEGRLTYEYDPKKYNLPFLNNNFFETNNANVTKKIYCFWTGDNPMSINRKNGYLSLKEKSGIEVVLVTAKNLQDFILPNFPLHDAYQFLNLIHKSDYLRCYFMHHYGGGYADIKTFRHSWKNSFKQLNKSNKYIIGYREVSENGVAKLQGSIYEDMKKHFPLLLGNGAFICKPQTSFTKEWYEELHNRLDNYLPFLRQQEQFSKEYPIPYTGLQGDIFHPLCLKYHKYILQNPDLKPVFNDYK